MAHQVTISDILSAFADWQEARKELAEAYENFRRSPDYHCMNLSEAEERMRIKVGEKLDAYIDQRIETATGARP